MAFSVPLKPTVVDGFSRADVRSYDSTPWRPSAEVEKKVTALQKDLGIRRPDIYNGPVVRVNDFDIIKGTLSFDLEPTDYVHYLATRDDANPGDNVTALFVALNVLTADGKYAIGTVSSGEVLGARDIVSGAVQPLPDVRSGFPYLDLGLYTEMVDEFGLRPEDFIGGDKLRIQPSYMVGNNGSFSLVYTGFSNLDSEGLKSRFEKEVLRRYEQMGKTPEMNELTFIDATEEGLSKEVDLNGSAYHPSALLVVKYLAEHPELLSERNYAFLP